MNREEYYNRVKKTRNKTITDRTSKDEDYQICCQVNYLSKRYIETLENALDEIEKFLNKNGNDLIDDYSLFSETYFYEELKEIIKKAKGDIK